MFSKRRLLFFNNIGKSAGGSVVAPPTLVSLNTATGSTLGGTVIIATGTNLTGASAVSVGGNPATAVSALDATHVQFTTPAGSAGAASITVTTPGGTSSPLAGAFTYVVVAAPVLESISADIGIAAGGTKQTLRGYGLTGTTGVTFGGSAATSLVVVSDNVITCATPSGSASETGVDVVVTNSAGSSTLSAAYEYGAVTGTTQASEDFHASSYGVLTNDQTAGGTNSIINVPYARGSTTKCVQSSTPTSGDGACVSLAIANNTPLNATHGQFLQWDASMPSATIALILGAGQIKNSLVRPTPGGSSPANLMIGAGVQFSGAGSQMLFAIDNGIVGVLGSVNGALLGDNNWQGIAQQLTRTAGVSGRARVWRKGPIAGSGYKLVMVATSANIGGDVTTTSYTPKAGLEFTQAASAGTLNVYTANVQMSDGWLEPLNT